MNKSNPEISVIVPTYCEKHNIAHLVAALEESLAGIDWLVTFVDDNSPDGTAGEGRRIAADNPRVRIIVRTSERGLAGACIAGLNAATTPYVAVIDADMQHDEGILPAMLAQLKAGAADIVVGSRNVAGGSSSKGLSPVRELGSRTVTRLAGLIPGVSISDPMSGFFALRRDVYEAVAHRLTPQGFKILLDILAAGRGKLRVTEIPYEMRARKNGASKLDTTVTLELVALLISLLAGGRLPVRFLMFAVVGGTGVFVHIGVLSLLEASSLIFELANSIAAIMAVFSNFLLNNLLTFRDKALKGRAFWGGLWRFYMVCAFGFVGNLSLAVAAYDIWQNRYLAALLGICFGAVLNYIGGARYAWRHG